MKRIGLLIAVIFFLVAIFTEGGRTAPDPEVSDLWTTTSIGRYISADLLGIALRGYHLTDSVRRKKIMTIIDYSKSSAEERFFVLDIEHKKLLYHCLVAHGKNSGEYYATSFSNKLKSLKSSLGFFLTAETYTGKHGFALRLDGLERGINDNARVRDLVIHGADYVSEDFVKIYGRLGKSWGCPALPVNISSEIIRKIADGSCLFIYAKDDTYFRNSRFAGLK